MAEILVVTTKHSWPVSHGTSRAQIIRWIEKMESVLDISDCSEDNKVKYATCTFQDEALTWWNVQVQTMGRTTAYSQTWDELKTLMLNEYCP